MAASASTERNHKIGKQLGKYCVAGGPGNLSCKNNSCVEGISMHGFPKSEGNLRKTWIKFVQKHRPNWQPSPYSALCSANFKPRFYLQRPDIDIRQLETNQSFRTKRMLDRKVAYPTIDTVEPERPATTISPRERRQVRCIYIVCVIVIYISLVNAVLQLLLYNKYLVEYAQVILTIYYFNLNLDFVACKSKRNH